MRTSTRNGGLREAVAGVNRSPKTGNPSRSRARKAGIRSAEA